MGVPEEEGLGAGGEGSETMSASDAPLAGAAPVSGVSGPLVQAQATTAPTTSMPVSTSTRRRQ